MPFPVIMAADFTTGLFANNKYLFLHEAMIHASHISYLEIPEFLHVWLLDYIILNIKLDVMNQKLVKE